MGIAFFDLDKTLIADNSARLYIWKLYQQRDISLLQLLQASYWIAKYHLGFTNIEDFIKRGLDLLSGEDANEVQNRTNNFYHSTIKNLYRPGALLAIKAHQKLGQKIALLTSSFYELSSLVQKELHFDFCLCTRLEIDKYGYYTGKTLGPPCFGKNKVNFAKNLCHETGISLKHCTFYTDSASDIPLLAVVGRAVCVNPDPHLLARAHLKGWDIVDWGKPHEPKKS
jgi:HAD superfamily hydrolase (TIGR01490 family)